MLGEAADGCNLDVVLVGGTATFLRITKGDKRDVGFALGHAKISDGLALAAALGTIALGFTSDGKGEAGDTKGLTVYFISFISEVSHRFETLSWPNPHLENRAVILLCPYMSVIAGL